MDSGQINPILSIEATATTEEDRAHLERSVGALIQENPQVQISFDSQAGRLLIGGEDEALLERVCQKILAIGPLELSEPRIAHRETIRKAAEAEGKYIRQTGGSGNYGHCWLKVEPNEAGKGYEFVNDIKGGVVPREYIKPIEQGVQGAMELGILAGYPMVDVKVTLTDGSYHEVDSNEMAFKFAGSIAFKEAARKASPVLLEPVMAFEGTVPEEFMGTFIGDINLRRGRIEGMEPAAGLQVIKAVVPLAEMLRSSVHGRPKYATRFLGFEPAPWRNGRGDDDAAAFANRPRGPKPRDGSATARGEL
jgi:elongation factor G